MSVLDRDIGRQYESGAAKRKAKLERVARETEVLPKLTGLFVAKSNGDNNPGTDVAEIATTSLKSADDLAEIPPEEHGEVAIGVQEYDFVPETPDTPLTPYNLFNPFSCDMGIWPAHVSDSMREYWTPKGSVQYQNLDKEFSESSTRFEGEKYNRQCLKACSHTLTSSQNSNILGPGSATRHRSTQCTVLPANLWQMSQCLVNWDLRTGDTHLN